jgi:predicted ATPase
MAVHLQFEGIRCFIEPQDVAIRPITLLVGENSSGKSTFLALCQIAYALAQGTDRALPFNEPPFLLGAYDQIASYRGGRAGRARSFSLTISLDGGPEPQSLRGEFISWNGQPWLDVWRLTAGDHVLEAKSGTGGEQHPGTLRGPRSIGEAPEAPLDIRDAISVAVSHPDQALRQAALEILYEIQNRPYAFAPIRTSPQRTYDPVSSEPRPEGSHIPMLLATLAQSASSQGWSAMQSALQDFGLKSGLFDGIEIVNKGRKESDPFQIGIKSGGPTVNLIDVGYGVSQALPLLVDTIQRAAGHELFLLQQPEVHLHPRAQAELGSFFASQARKERKFVIETHSDHLVDRIRMEVRRKVLKSEDVSLLYFERGKHGATIHNLELDRNGSITNPPEGYRQFFMNEERDLLGI